MRIEPSTKTVRGQGQCPIHGEFSYIAQRRGDIIVGDQCQKCLSERLRKNEEILAREEAQAKKAALDARLKACGVPAVFMDATFDNFIPRCDEATTARNWAHKYATKFGTQDILGRGLGMIMRGAQGSGKTHLACAIIRSLIEQGFVARYVTAALLLSRINEAPFGNFESRMSTEEAMQPYVTPHLLVIDDIDVRTGTSTDYRSLFMVIDQRWASGVSTIAISNRTNEEINKEWGERAVTRIINGGPNLNFTWSGMRGKRRV